MKTVDITIHCTVPDDADPDSVGGELFDTLTHTVFDPELIDSVDGYDEVRT